MSKMKRYFSIIIFFVVVAGIVAGVYISNTTQVQPPAQTTPSPTPYAGVGFRGIDINTATAGGVISVMGNPKHTDIVQNKKTLIYNSDVGNQPIDVDTDTNKKIQSIVEPAPAGTKLSVLREKLGKEDIILYGNYYYSGYYLFTYLTLGTAILANPTTDDVKQSWYFSPTDLPAFLQTVGIGFQTSPLPSGQE